jgi:ABC-type lipoprotein export system ATPase subunit
MISSVRLKRKEELMAAGVEIGVERVTKVYGHSKAVVEALRGVSIGVSGGERLSILGKSGSGKSTLLGLLGGLDRPTSGSLQVGGRELSRLTERELAKYRLETVGIIFQAYNLVVSKTALENVELPMILAGMPPAERRPLAREALEAVGLGHRLDHRPVELSGGEHQRVAIARALVNRPALLLADEPTGNLDSTTANEIMALLLDKISRTGTTMVLVSHDADLARRAGDRVIEMRDGRVVSWQ